jgi:hypothetical protein
MLQRGFAIVITNELLTLRMYRSTVQLRNSSVCVHRQAVLGPREADLSDCEHVTSAGLRRTDLHLSAPLCNRCTAVTHA